MSRGSETGVALDPDIVHEAAVWLMQLHSGEITETERDVWLQWRHRSEVHECAWQRAERLMQTTGGIPAVIGTRTFERMGRGSRRHALKLLSAAMLAGPAVWVAYRASPWHDGSADAHTAIGEQREWVLEDGTRLLLNTDSAVDLHFDAQQRRVRLRRGEIFVATAQDPTQRPFWVETPQGRVRPIGTRFSVRRYDDQTGVAVFSGEVEVEPLNGGTHRVRAGEQRAFSAASMDLSTADVMLSDAWTRGLLVADELPLAELVAELARYRPGILRCDPAIADLRISGVFQLADPDQVLTLLSQTFPVKVDTRLRWWVTLRPRG